MGDDVVVYRAPRVTWRTVVALVAGGLLIGRGALYVTEGYERGLISVGVFGFGMVMTLVSIAHPFALELTAQGLRATSFGTGRTFLWQDCSDFHRKGRRGALVFTEHVSNNRRKFVVGGGSAQRLGGNRVVPIPRTVAAEDLLRQIQLLQQRARAPRDEPSA